MKYLLSASILLFMFLSCNETNDLLNQILQKNKTTLGAVIADAEKYEVQIRYTQINRDANNFPTFKTFDYRVDSSTYFYPASTVKMPVAVLAMERINQLQKELDNELTIHSTMKTDSIRAPQTAVNTDSTAANGLPSVAHYVKKIFAVSDNDAFNRLYEFLGREHINKSLHKKGIHNSRILHRLSVGGFDNRYTNPVQFFDDKNSLYQQAEQFDETLYPNSIKGTSKGIAYIKDGKKINEPFDFSVKNAFAIKDLEAVMKAIIFPEVMPETQRFDLKETDYQYLYKVMSSFPREHQFPKYDPVEYYDSYVKFFMYGDKKEPIPDHIRIFNKVGYAYGFLTDCAYIVDFQQNIEFLLTATIHVNANKTYNDDTYEYDEVGIPFLANLGRAVYEYELKRERKHRPNLERYKN